MNTILSKLQHNYYDILKVLLFIIAIAIVVWISPRESMFKYEFNIGKPWNHNDLIAPYDFSIYKTDKQITEEKAQVLSNFRPYFRYDEDVTGSGRHMLTENFGELWQVSDASQRSEDSIKLLKVLTKIYDDIQKTGVIQYHEILDGKGQEYPIRIIHGNEVSNASLGEFYDVHTANTFANNKINKLKDQDSSLLKLIISQSLVQNVFYDEADPILLSETARHYIGGLLTHAASVLAFTNPSTNSYRRLIPGFEAPVNAFFSSGNRSAAIRIPKYATQRDQVRFEFRPPDATCNPYLAMAAMLLAGLDGIKKEIDPTEAGFGPINEDIFSWPLQKQKSIKSLPTSLHDALNALEKDMDYLLVENIFPTSLIEQWLIKKYKEDKTVRSRPHPYEIELYSDI